MINREYYLNKIIGFIDKDFVKLLIGVRRSGKSTLLMLLKQHLISSGVSENNIIEVNFEHMRFDSLKDGIKLHDWLDQRLKPNERYYLLFDEVQEINEWARVINSVRVSYNVDIYATGSNSRIFIGEHLTYLAGRYVSFHIYPLSINEYMKFKNLAVFGIEEYRDYIKGSFPSFVLSDNEQQKQDIMKDLYDSIFQRDILLRNDIRNEPTFVRVSQFLFENIGRNVSFKKISDTLKSLGNNIYHTTVENYIDSICKSYCLYHCPRYDVKGKQILQTNGKYYAVDLGLRDYIIPQQGINSGSMFENIIYLELLKAGYKVTTGKIGRDYEIDFVASKGDKTLYIQVTESLIDPATREREERVFNYINDKHKRIIVTLDSYKINSPLYYHLNLVEFVDEIQ